MPDDASSLFLPLLPAMDTVKDRPREATDIATRSPSAVHFLPPGAGRLPAASGPEAAAEAGLPLLVDRTPGREGGVGYRVSRRHRTEPLAG
ncbi:hypothetical protein CH63R_04989 [Colletotrichum higginsianum IMI 349063]|uniref:Uncharacterized protein n=1 Tax=Colletotrichum higginsianum (strain IMI 349063) TaxID=759273 RepID=A0A1B7YKW8_COLHI|nr:hypothetical protein CH63R_04989 [Colletotrichum higginsianum IMI 349063]OBR12693.1 hypothetical protein CH63R_04989 [Colletotrichum higginsianum IMI 349063]